MSLSRALYNEFHPLFRMLEDPFAWQPSSNRAEPFGWHRSRPALNLHEEEDGSYVIEAEVPGVKKEDLNVRVGDGGRSISIEGQVARRGQQPRESTSTPANTGAPRESTSRDLTSTSNGKQPSSDHVIGVVTNVLVADADKQVSTNTDTAWSDSRTFSRTVWLPHSVNKDTITAKLEDGILTVRATKANQEAFSVRVD
jgi:HSP20 family molecular chaperone IbpA